MNTQKINKFKKLNNRGNRFAFNMWLERQNVLELSQALGCHTQLIYFWKSGKCKPSTKYVQGILDTAGEALTLSDIIPANTVKK